MKCSLCGNSLLPGRGKLYAQIDGTINYFCDGTCEKHFLMGRVGKKLKWTATSQKERPRAEKTAQKASK